MADLNKIAIRHAALSNRIVIARFGKDPNVALDRRDAMNDFFQALASYAFDGSVPKEGAEETFTFGGGDEQFSVTVKRMKEPDHEDR